MQDERMEKPKPGLEKQRRNLLPVPQGVPGTADTVPMRGAHKNSAGHSCQACVQAPMGVLCPMASGGSALCRAEQ